MSEPSPQDRRFAGVSVPRPEFADDDGSCPAPLAAVLAAYDAGHASVRDVVAALAGSRLMTPLVAVLDEEDDPAPDGLRREKSSHMASVSLVAPDGRRGLLAFSSVAAMAAWDPTARGIPAPAARVAAAALEEGADAVLLDLAGPVRVAVDGMLLRALAVGAPPPAPYADPAVHTAVAQAVAGLPGLEDLVLEQPEAGDDAPDLVLLLRASDAVDVAELASSVVELVLAHPVVAAACPRGVAVGLLPGTGTSGPAATD